MSAKKTVSIVLEAEHVRTLDQHRGGMSMSAFCRVLIVRALAGELARRDAQETLPFAEPPPRDMPQTAAHVRIDMTPLVEAIEETHELIAEVLRAVHQYGQLAAARDGVVALADANDEAVRLVAQWRNRNGGMGQ